MDYYYQNPTSNRVGPLDEATFLEHANAGAIAANALVWRSGEDAWRVWTDAAAAWSFGGGEEIVPAEPTVPAISADIGIDSLFGDSWKIFKKHWGKFLVTGIVCGVPSLVGNVTSIIADYAELVSGQKDFALSASATFLILFSTALAAIFSFGYLKIARKEDTGKTAKFEDVLPLSRFFSRFLQFLGQGLVILFAAFGVFFLGTLSALFGAGSPTANGSIYAALLGFAAFLVGIFVFVRYAFACIFVFDTNCGVFESFTASWKITQGHFWRTLWYGILTTFIFYIGAIFTLGLATFILMPLVLLWYSVYYIKLCKTSEAPVPASVYAE